MWTTSLYTSTNSTTSFDTRPHESMWIYGTNYAHARTVDTRPFFWSGRGLGTRLYLPETITILSEHTN